jgi:hypothetical protein
VSKSNAKIVSDIELSLLQVEAAAKLFYCRLQNCEPAKDKRGLLEELPFNPLDGK